ncbi:MAG: bifunctional YncE family protein/alkaline phosphatase family protein [Pyrinomonadaceae bacterium]
MNRVRKHQWRQAVLPALVILMAMILVGVTASTADITISNQPASEGRRITPAGALLLDAKTHQRAVGALPVKFVRSPDSGGPDGLGRYLIAVNSGFGLQFNAASNLAQQSLAVIDLNLKPQPACVQNVYFPSPQSVNVGLAFARELSADNTYALYISGGFENKIWIFRFNSKGTAPISPASPGPNTTVTAPFIDVSGFSQTAASPNYNDDRAPVYPTGIALSPDDDTLFVANNLGDNLGIISNLSGGDERRLSQVDLRRENREQFVYPYEVLALPDRAAKTTAKVYVSCWNDASIAVIDPQRPDAVANRIQVARHPTAMIFNRDHTRLFVVNSNADSVSVIDTANDREIERIDVRLAEKKLIGESPEGLALSFDEKRLYVANAHSNAIAVVDLSVRVREGEKQNPSIVRGFFPTGQYPSAVAVAGNMIYVGNGKGTGVENSSVVVNNSGRAPNAPNDRFPAGAGGRGVGRGGQYSLSVVTGNISVLPAPNERALARYTQLVMRNNSLLGPQVAKLFKGPSPIKHVIYIIKENRTYDQVFGDVARAGNGQAADGDPSLAIFGSGAAARREGGPVQNITPNHRALAMRFGLLDRFFVNSEASPDGHNWSTAAFSSDYVDKAYRWEYSGRGRTYDYEGFNRLPSSPPLSSAASMSADDVASFMRRYVPYLNNSRDVAEPETLYLWDAAARKSLSYRNYGEFIATISEADLTAINTRRRKTYPDISPTIKTLATKKSLEGHHSPDVSQF